MKSYGSFYNVFGKLGEANIVVQAVFFITVASLIWLQDTANSVLDRIMK